MLLSLPRFLSPETLLISFFGLSTIPMLLFLELEKIPSLYLPSFFLLPIFPHLSNRSSPENLRHHCPQFSFFQKKMTLAIRKDLFPAPLSLSQHFLCYVTLLMKNFQLPFFSLFPLLVSCSSKGDAVEVEDDALGVATKARSQL